MKEHIRLMSSLNGGAWTPEIGAIQDWAGGNRSDRRLVQVVKKLKAKASDHCAKLTITKIPSDVQWTISEYDGLETVEEIHRSWN